MISIHEIARRYVAEQSQTIEPIAPRSLFRLLPLLEHDYKLARGAFSEALGEREVSASTDMILLGLVRLALCEPSEHWSSLALTWLDAGFPATRDLSDALHKCSSDSVHTQATRHRAWRYLNHNKPNKSL